MYLDNKQMSKEDYINELSESVDHPPHYISHPSGIECIEVTRHMNFNLGNVFKYLWRCDNKGHHLEDLQKAAWYLNDEIEKIKESVN